MEEPHILNSYYYFLVQNAKKNIYSHCIYYKKSPRSTQLRKEKGDLLMILPKKVLIKPLSFLSPSLLRLMIGIPKNRQGASVTLSKERQISSEKTCV